MSIQVSNINSIEPEKVKFVEVSGSERPLPPINFVVAINILEKVKDGYKVLIEGRVFFSKLPVNVSINETIIAKVTNHSPFILSLDNFASIKGMDEVLSLLISKLQISSSKQTEKVLRSFLLNRKPVVKSRLEKLSDLLDSQQLELEEDQLTEIVIFLESDEANYQSISTSLLNLFKYKNSELAAGILHLVQELNNLQPLSEIVKELNSMMVLDLDAAEKVEPIMIKEYSNNLESVFKFVCNVHDNIPSGRRGTILKELIDKMLIYNFRKALMLRNGNFSSFIIVRVNQKLELLEFDLESIDKTFSFNLNMHPENLNCINAHGLFKENKLSLGLKSEPAVNSFFRENRGDLENRLENNIHCRYDIKFFSENDAANTIPIRSGKLNVTY